MLDIVTNRQSAATSQNQTQYPCAVCARSHKERRMNGVRFDQLARRLGQATTRRSLLGGATGLAGVGMLAPGGHRAASARYAQGTPAATPSAQADLRVRKNAAALTADEKLRFVSAVRGLKKKPSPWLDDVSVYDTFVLWHRDAFGCALMAAHMGPAFFPWHRQFLLVMEEQLRLVE